MIRKVKYSDDAISIAADIFRQHVAKRLHGLGFGAELIEIGAIPVFQLSLDQAIALDWKLTKRRGWRFICTATNEDIGAIIGVRKRPWSKPAFSGFSIGRRAVLHNDAARRAAEWASMQLRTHVARIVRVIPTGIDLLCIYEIGGIAPVWIADLSTRSKGGDSIDEIARAAGEYMAKSKARLRSKDRDIGELSA
jgi:hypothetical protein